jgi:protein arginine N-methyltransferase 5
MNRWFAEPVKIVVLPTGIFLRNAKGFPVLSKQHQTFVSLLLRNKPEFVIEAQDFPAKEDKVTLGHYREYLVHLYNSLPAMTAIDKFAVGYNDYLQAPLQVIQLNSH